MEKESTNIYRCDCTAIHKEILQKVNGKMIDNNLFNNLSDLFKIFGDQTRLKILWALDNSEMCVCDIAVLLDMTKSAISHQLKVLKQAKLVDYRREGKMVYYFLDDDHVKHIFEDGLNHIKEK